MSIVTDQLVQVLLARMKAAEDRIAELERELSEVRRSASVPRGTEKRLNGTR